ncbi:MAG: hypothetical protein NVSMB9_20850 [Isosphaeraceae bacterium]
MGVYMDGLNLLIARKEARDRAEGTEAGTMVGRVVTPSAQIAVGKFLTVQPVSIFGDEVEAGMAVTVVDTSASVPVYLVGPRPAQQGDLLVCRFVQFRWVADRGGSTQEGVIGKGCTCSGGVAGSTPATVYQHVVVSSYPDNTIFFPATLEYGSTPPEYMPLAIGDENWFSRETFHDQGSSQDAFRYLFRCESGMYVLRKAYAQSIHGSPYMTPYLYLWGIGFPGNNCQTAEKPFQLNVGRIYTGGDPQTRVVIDTKSNA